MTIRSNLRLCHRDPRVVEVRNSGECPGDGYVRAYGSSACPTPTRWELGGIRRCTRHTASVLYDLPVSAAS